MHEKYIKLNIITLFVFINDNIYSEFRPSWHKIATKVLSCLNLRTLLTSSMIHEIQTSFPYLKTVKPSRPKVFVKIERLVNRELMVEQRGLTSFSSTTGGRSKKFPYQNELVAVCSTMNITRNLRRVAARRFEGRIRSEFIDAGCSRLDLESLIRRERRKRIDRRTRSPSRPLVIFNDRGICRRS